jgi:acyl-coenzyme A thioesterase PaaI-like protein
MRKIKNPYLKLSTYNCFGCSPKNPIGLHLSFVLENDEVVTHWTPTREYEGWYNILHGGIQATLMDEISSWVVLSVLKTSGFTVKMNVQLHQNILISEGEIELRATLKSKKLSLAVIEVRIFNAKKEICSEGEYTYYIFPKDKAIERFHFPENENELFED